MSPAVLDHAASEAKLAFVQYVDENAGAGKGAGEIWRDAYLLGYRAALNPRSIIQIEADAAAALAAEFGATA